SRHFCDSDGNFLMHVFSSPSPPNVFSTHLVNSSQSLPHSLVRLAMPSFSQSFSTLEQSCSRHFANRATHFSRQSVREAAQFFLHSSASAFPLQTDLQPSQAVLQAAWQSEQGLAQASRQAWLLSQQPKTSGAQ